MPTQQELDQSKNAYISPSDTIMSPTTKKLSEMKGKRFASGKPQSLFAKTVGKQAQAQAQAQAQGQPQPNEHDATKSPTKQEGAEGLGKENVA